MRVFVTGASGWIGSAVIPELLAQGHKVLGRPALDEDRAALWVQVRLAQRERFADPSPCPPQDDNQAAEPEAIGIIASGSYYRDDLLDSGWSGG